MGSQSYRIYLQSANRLTEERRSQLGFYAHKSDTDTCPVLHFPRLELTNDQLTGVQPVLTEFVEKLTAKLNGTDYDPRGVTSRGTDVETSPTGKLWQICSRGIPASTRAVKGRQTEDDLRIRAVLKKVSSTAESSDTAKVEDQDAVHDRGHKWPRLA